MYTHINTQIYTHIYTHAHRCGCILANNFRFLFTQDNTINTKVLCQGLAHSDGLPRAGPATGHSHSHCHEAATQLHPTLIHNSTVSPKAQRGSSSSQGTMYGRSAYIILINSWNSVLASVCCQELAHYPQLECFRHHCEVEAWVICIASGS